MQSIKGPKQPLVVSMSDKQSQASALACAVSVPPTLLLFSGLQQEVQSGKECSLLVGCCKGHLLADKRRPQPPPPTAGSGLKQLGPRPMPAVAPAGWSFFVFRDLGDLHATHTDMNNMFFVYML